MHDFEINDMHFNEGEILYCYCTAVLLLDVCIISFLISAFHTTQS